MAFFVKTISVAGRGAPTKLPGGPAGGLELARRLLRDRVDAPVHVRVRGLVVVVHRVEHGSGTLGGGGRVEIDEPLAVRLLLEQRELLTEGGDVERAQVDGGGHERNAS